LNTAPTSQRIASVKTVLLDFLRTYEFHISNKQLHPDDLERRAIILSAWWNLLLDLLEYGSVGSSGLEAAVVADTDRPPLLEATTKLMMRPEWRQASENWLPVSDRPTFVSQQLNHDTQQPNKAIPGPISNEPCNTRAAGQQADLPLSPSPSPPPASIPAEVARHNVGVLFTRNLIRQMHLVTTKMSRRYTPLHFAFFCGKACAYAFFFVPGAADVMVRLWGLGTDVLRSAAQELGLSTAKRTQLQASCPQADALCLIMPASLSSLSWTEINGGAKLKRPAQIPVQVSQIPWNGAWVSRWKGRDTDLLFVFFKYFHILFAEFVSEGTPLSVQAHAPAFALVHAQLLEIIDSTIHRQASLAMEQRPIVSNADIEWLTSSSATPASSSASLMSLPDDLPLSDAKHGSDATMNAMRFPSSNLRRGMSDNRLIATFRDVLSSRPDKSTAARHTFAEASMAMLQAATKRTSRFDQQACFTLCDFLEEVLSAYHSGFDQQEGTESSNNVSTAGDDKIKTRGQDSSDTVPLDGEPVPSTATDAPMLSADRPGLHYVDWPFWLDSLSKMLEGHNTMLEIRVLSFVFTVWDIVVAEPARKEKFVLNWLLSERIFDKFFNHWSPMIRAYWMRLLCWRICREAGDADDLDT